MNNNHKGSVAVAALVALCLAVPSFGAEKESSVKEGAKEAGHAVGSAMREVGEGAKEVTKAIGHGAKEGVEALKEGGREVKKGIKGEKKD